jgi:hypothetical protein
MVRVAGKDVGYKRIIIIAVISTTFVVIVDHMGLINKVASIIPGGDW